MMAKPAAAAMAADSFQPLAPGQRRPAWGVIMVAVATMNKMDKSLIETPLVEKPFKPSMLYQISYMVNVSDTLNGTQAKLTRVKVTSTANGLGKLSLGIRRCLR